MRRRIPIAEKDQEPTGRKAEHAHPEFTHPADRVVAAMTSMMTSPVMTARLGRERILAAPTMAPSTTRLGRTFQVHHHIGPPTTRTRTRTDNRSRATTPLAFARSERDLTHPAPRAGGIAAATTTPSSARRLGRSGHRIAAATPATPRGLGRPGDATASTTTFGVRLTAKRALARCDHPCRCAPLSSGAVLSATLLPLCHWRLLGGRSLPILALMTS
jgi:hypothetical protein